MARQPAAGSDLERHHASLQRANRERADPRVPSATIAARRGLPPAGDFERLGAERRQIEPAVAENPRDWLKDSTGETAAEDDSELGREWAEEQEIGIAAQDAAQQAVATAGTDAIAFYLPITFYGPRHYGIYVRQNRFFGFCAMVQQYATQFSWHEVTASVFQFLLHHEAYHAAVELSCLASDDFQERSPARTYSNYFDLAVGPWRLAHGGPTTPYRCHEEQLAQHAGMSRMPENACGEAIRSALIHISHAGPADYFYDPAAWPRSGKAKKAQAALEQALHRVQSTCLLRRPPPTAFDDIHARIEPQAWFPPGDSHAVLSGTFGIVPVYVIDCSRSVALRFARACSLGNIPMKDFIRAVCRMCNVTHDETGGKHPRLIVGDKQYKVTYPRSARTTPLYVIKQVANLLELSKEDLIAQCQL